jgi:peptidoglycan hydrolase-like protein with peptidoglycan-binding domain
MKQPELLSKRVGGLGLRAVNMPILKKGSKGELVSCVQERLTNSGDYKATIDGDFGDMTVDFCEIVTKASEVVG